MSKQRSHGQDQDDETSFLRERVAQLEQEIRRLNGDAGKNWTANPDAGNRRKQDVAGQTFPHDAQAIARALLSASHEWAVIIDPSGLIMAANEPAAGTFGQKAQDIIGRNIFGLIPKELVAPRRKHLDKVVAECRPVSFDDVSRGRDVHTRFYPISNQQGNAALVAIFATDVTEFKQTLQALVRTNERLSNIFDNSPDAIFEINLDGDFTMVNPVGPSTTGYSIEAMLKLNLKDLVAPEHLQHAMSVISALAAGEPVVQPFYLEILHKDGSRVPSEFNVNGVYREGRLHAVQGIARNITRRKRAEDALAASEAKYRLLVENVNDGIWAIDAQSNTTFVNRRMTQMLGYSVDEMIGRHLFEFADEEGIRVARMNIERRKQGIQEQHEFTLIRKDGSKVVTSMVTSPIMDEAGTYRGAVAVVEDITERKKIEQALLASQQRYRAIVEDQTELICRFGPDGTLSFVNEAFGTYFGKSPEQLVGAKLGPHVLKEDLPKAGAAVNAVTWETPVRATEVRVYVNGQVRWQHWTVRGKFDDRGNLIEMQGVGQDITERRIAEEALALLHGQLMSAREQERSRLARDLHDSIGQRMIAMSYSLQGLIDQKRRTTASLGKLSKMCNEIIREIRQICQGLYPPTLESLGLASSLRQIANDCRCGMRVRVSVSRTLAKMRFGSDREIGLFRIAQEALHNALRHSQAKSVLLRLAKAGDDLVLTIQDDGCGFDPGANAGGLGLTTMRERASAIGAEVTFTSRPGSTRVTVRLPQKAARPRGMD